MPQEAQSGSIDISVPPQAREIARRVDVAIVVGGMGGSALAYALGRAGMSVAVIDLHAACPPEFRAEKLAGDQIELLRRLGLLDELAQLSTSVHETISARRQGDRPAAEIHRRRVYLHRRVRSWLDMLAKPQIPVPRASQAA